MSNKVSVVMSVHNGEQYLRDSLESILHQTFRNFEFIIIDDGSTDNSWKLLTEYAHRDSRIVLIQNSKNIGLTKSLNKGLQCAKGKYIARQDADDISFPERLEKQVSYMESHQTVGLLATGIEYIDSEGNPFLRDMPPQNRVLLGWYLLFRNPLRHSTVLWRQEAVSDKVGEYDPEFTYAQDYDLWSRIFSQFIIATLPEVLVWMRWHRESISLRNTVKQDAFGVRVSYKQIHHYLSSDDVTEGDVKALRLMPRHRDNLQSQYLANLSISHFKRAVSQYMILWKRYVSMNEIIYFPSELHILQDDLEQDILELIRYCKRRRRPVTGGYLILLYLCHRPTQLLRISQTLLWRYFKSHSKVC